MREKEIRPKAVFEEYLRLAEADVKIYFRNCEYRNTPCVACGSRENRFAFFKKGFSYAECPRCETLFVTPRPVRSAFDAYYRDSPSTRYWATNFYRISEKVRRKLIFKPRVELLMKLLEEHSSRRRIAWIADIGAGYGIFCEEVRRILPETAKVVAIEPSHLLSRVCRAKKIPVVQKCLEDVMPADLPRDGGMGMLTSFELLEHVHDPMLFLRKCRTLLQPGDLLLFSTLNGKGFDIQFLWDRSRSVFPPHHINFFNVKSMELLIHRAGFRVLDISTPGKLDVDILSNAIDQVDHRFMRSFLMQATTEAKEELQAWISKHRLSSHMLVVATPKSTRSAIDLGRVGSGR